MSAPPPDPVPDNSAQLMAPLASPMVPELTLSPATPPVPAASPLPSGDGSRPESPGYFTAPRRPRVSISLDLQPNHHPGSWSPAPREPPAVTPGEEPARASGSSVKFNLENSHNSKDVHNPPGPASPSSPSSPSAFSASASAATPHHGVRFAKRGHHSDLPLLSPGIGRTPRFQEVTNASSDDDSPMRLAEEQEEGAEHDRGSSRGSGDGSGGGYEYDTEEDLTPTTQKHRKVRRSFSMGKDENDGSPILRRRTGMVRHHSIATTTPHREALAQSLVKSRDRTSLAASLTFEEPTPVTESSTPGPPSSSLLSPASPFPLIPAPLAGKTPAELYAERRWSLLSPGHSVRSSIIAISAPNSPRSNSPVPVSPSPVPETFFALHMEDHTKSFERKSLRFNEEADVIEVDSTQYPFPQETKDYPKSPARSLPPPLLYEQHKKLVVSKLRELVKKYYPITYGDLLRIAIGKFALGGDLPPYVEDFMEWLVVQKWTDPTTSKIIKLNWMDRRWLKPIIEETWGVHIKYSPGIIL